MTLVVIYWLVLLSCWFLVVKVGDKGEQLCLTVYALASLATALVVSPMDRRYDVLEWRILAIDIIVLLSFLAMVIQSKRYWPLWTTGFQMVGVLGHTAVLSPASRRAYAMTLGIIAYMVLATLVIAACRSQARRNCARSSRR